MKLLLSGRTFCVYLQPCTSLQCHFIPSHISRVDHFFRTCTPPAPTPFINHVNQSLAMDHRLLRPLFVDPLPPPPPPNELCKWILHHRPPSFKTTFFRTPPPPPNYANEPLSMDHHLLRPLFLSPPNPPPPMNYANELLTMDHHLLRTLFQNPPGHELCKWTTHHGPPSFKTTSAGLLGVGGVKRGVPLYDDCHRLSRTALAVSHGSPEQCPFLSEHSPPNRLKNHQQWWPCDGNKLPIMTDSAVVFTVQQQINNDADFIATSWIGWYIYIIQPFTHPSPTTTETRKPTNKMQQTLCPSLKLSQ